MANMIDGLAYGGNSLADRFAGTDWMGRSMKREADARAAEQAARAKRAAFQAALKAGQVPQALWRPTYNGLEIQVTVLRVSHGGVRIAYNGCKQFVSPLDLHELAAT